jgi:hypothetical protein
MIRIIRATHLGDFNLELEFSDGTVGHCDFGPLATCDGPLAVPLRDPRVFLAFSLAVGTLSWPHGLEFGAASLHRRLAESGRLRRSCGADDN